MVLHFSSNNSTIPVAGETREDLAEQVALGFQILAAASGKPAEEIYKDVDLHLSDSTNHNKHIGEDVAELFQMDTAFVCWLVKS